MDFFSDSLINGGRFRTLTAVDNYSRECPLPEAAFSLTGKRVVAALDKVALSRGYSRAITVDNRSEFISSAMDDWLIATELRQTSFEQENPQKIRILRALMKDFVMNFCM